MTIRKRMGGLFLGTLVIVVFGQLSLEAQEPASSKTAPAAKKKQDPSRRVPPYFGQIGLSTEQRASIYSIQAKHIDKIDALEKQVAAEKAAMLGECEGTLTDTQKKLLENLRRAASEPTAKSAETSKSSN